LGKTEKAFHSPIGNQIEVVWTDKRAAYSSVVKMMVSGEGIKVAGPLVREQLIQRIRQRLLNSPAEASGLDTALQFIQSSLGRLTN